MVRENTILVCVQLNKLPGLAVRLVILQLFQTFIIAVFHKIERDVKLVSSLVSISTVPEDLRAILVPRPTETRLRGLSIDPPGRNCSQNKNTHGEFIVLSIYLLDTCKM